MNPDVQVKNEHGELRPECFGHHGYGNGYLWPGRCDVRICRSGGECYAMLRKQVEERDPEAAAEYEARRQLLREEGLDSNAIVTTLAAQGFAPTTLDAVLENDRQGKLASNLWRECHERGCHTLIAKSHDSAYCRKHEPPKEDDDGDGGHEVGGAPPADVSERAGSPGRTRHRRS